MSTDTLAQWLDRLGYLAEPAALHRSGEAIAPAHPYALELHAMLRPTGAIGARAVFDVEGVPTVVFVDANDGTPLTAADLDAIRQRIWNQNLASVVISVDGSQATALPARRIKGSGEALTLKEARSDGHFSAAEVRSSDLSRRLPKWFDRQQRVDHKLLGSLRVGVSSLQSIGVLRERAEILMGQLLFVSYLEHRGIISDVYRQRRVVARMGSLIAQADEAGIQRLISQLRTDFNGDFLQAANGGDDLWSRLPPRAFEILHEFLSRTDLTTGQRDFWNYDFSFIPVELLSGIYESFLREDEKAKDGAYYTPRHLATLTVDRALAASPDPFAERIFDGACGSGILLTTAYRKLLALYEARQGAQLGFAERGRVLLRHIFGADINPMACRVTAFSLYLSLLEGLTPADVLEAQERDGVKLPTLTDNNLRSGPTADFFDDAHPFAGKRFSTLISNPAWTELPGGAQTAADRYAERVQAPFVRRQLAGLFSLKALDYLSEGGVLCLILPITQFLGPTSAPYVPYFFHRVQPLELINFGDLQGLLFQTAENTCHVLVGRHRPRNSIGRVDLTETFDYCVPKADLSLAFGRLTLQSADRHRVQTQQVCSDPQLLVTLMWGDADDLALWTGLTARGTFADFWSGPRAMRRWTNRKGVHFEDNHNKQPAVDAGPLQSQPFIPVDILRRGVPVLHPDVLRTWPKEQTHVARLSDDLIAIFDGPRVLYPDGFSKQEQSVRSVYFDGPGSFKHSVGVIAGPREDEDLLRFVSIYLRSSLARYFLMMRGWKMLCERNGVHLEDVETFPLFLPEQAPEPAAAARALVKVAEFSRSLEETAELAQASLYQQHQPQLDAWVYEYFGLTEVERDMVGETVEILMPSIRPRSYVSLDTPIQGRASRQDLERYATALARALTTWRDRMEGTGTFDVHVMASQTDQRGTNGIVRVIYQPGATVPAAAHVELDFELLKSTLVALRGEGLADIDVAGSVTLLPDTLIWSERALYITRPLTRRGWLTRTALRDAERIVRDVQGIGKRATKEST